MRSPLVAVHHTVAEDNQAAEEDSHRAVEGSHLAAEDSRVHRMDLPRVRLLSEMPQKSLGHNTPLEPP